ncbi:MAG TPA: glycosyltransferase family 1 protein [Gemmatimonadaceae bacterium]|nr:glycosyltransferase family 1 protein [Gemmatimonadaceae bacterium]
MHVGIDARFARDGGIGTYLRNMVPRVIRLRPSWSFTVLGNPAVVRGMGWEQLPNVQLSAFTAPAYSIREQWMAPFASPRGLNVFWAPHYNVPLAVRAPLVATIHDVCHLAVHDALDSGIKRTYARVMLDQVRRRARGILFVSEFSRDEMARIVGAPDGIVSIAPNAVAEEWFQGEDSARPLPDPYLAYVGNWKVHKNVPLLLRAFGRVVQRIPHRLVLVGRRHGLAADPSIEREVARLGDRVVVTGQVEDAEVRRWVRHADALVTASRYEGFGLPPLEAMAAGRPCMVARAGSLPEVCGDAARYCDPHDEASVANALVDIATNHALREELVRKGHVRARAFDWDRSARLAAELLEQVGKGR